MLNFSPKMALFVLVIFPALAAWPADQERGTIVREATLYVLPGSDSARVAQVARGNDVVVLEKTQVNGNQPWFKVFAAVGKGHGMDEDAGRTVDQGHDVTGWLPAPGVITSSTPNGDQIIFGEAVDSERQAEQRGGRKNAAQDAMQLYARVYELFPNSPLAPEALWRAGDIRWQLEKADVMARPSSRELDPDARNPMEEGQLKEVIKKFPHTKWADLAAYELIDNKLCGDWKGLTKCPEKESEIYEKYAHEHPQSPKVAEALYNAAWRQGALADIYKLNNERDKSAKAHKRALDLAQQVLGQNVEGDWKPRTLDLIYKLEQGIPLFGNSSQ